MGDMENALPIIFLGLSIIGFFLGAKKDTRFQSFYLFLFILASCVSFSANTADGENTLWLMLALVAGNFVLSKFEFFRKNIVVLVMAPLSALVLVLMSLGEVVQHVNQSYGLMNKFTVAAIVLAALTPGIVLLKRKVLSKLFKIENEDLTISIGAFVIGISVFLSVFGAGFIGALVVASIVSIISFYNPKWIGLAVSTVMLAVVGNLALQTGTTEIDVLSGDVLFGLFAGAFGVFLLTSLFASKKNHIIVSIATKAIVIFSALGLLYAGSVHGNMGGVDAVLAILIGGLLINVFNGSLYASLSIAAVVFAILFTVPPLLENEELKEFEAEMEHVIEPESKEEIVELDKLNSITGNYSIIADSSKISFYLGQKDETKGAIKKVNGKVKLTDDLKESTFFVEMKLEDLTTFDGSRNASLMSPDYFNAKKFPTMSFSSEELSELGENTFEADGVFEMLGITKPQKVTVKRLKTSSGVWLIGEGKIDRTIFGMTPSSSEGNVVTFSYKVLLN